MANTSAAVDKVLGWVGWLGVDMALAIACLRLFPIYRTKKQDGQWLCVPGCCWVGGNNGILCRQPADIGAGTAKEDATSTPMN